MQQIFMTGFSACIGLVRGDLHQHQIENNSRSYLVVVGTTTVCSLLVIPTLARISHCRPRNDPGHDAAPRPAKSLQPQGGSCGARPAAVHAPMLARRPHWPLVQRVA
jgi:hypothetical protein